MSTMNTSVITEAGLALNVKIQAGQCRASFTRAAIGTGIWDTETEDLKVASALKGEKQTVAFSEVTVEGKDKVLLKSIFTNVEVTEAYKVTELGIFADDPDEGEILYCIAACPLEEADLMPKNSGGNLSMVYSNYITVWDAANVTVTTPGAFAPAADFEILESRFNSMKETTEAEIKAIIAGTYVDDGSDKWEYEGYIPPAGEDDQPAADDADIQNIINGLYD